MASLVTDEDPTDDFDPEEFNMSNVSNTISMGDHIKMTSEWRGLEEYRNKIGIIIGRKDYGSMTLRDARQYVIRMVHYGKILVVGSDAFKKITRPLGVNYPKINDRIIITRETPGLSRFDKDEYYLKTGQIVRINANTMELSYEIKMDGVGPRDSNYLGTVTYLLNDFIVYDFLTAPYEPENINKFVFVHGGGSRPENTMYPGYVGKIVGESTDQGGVPVKIINTRKLEMVSEGNVVYNLRDIRVIRTEVLAGPEYVWHAIRGDNEPTVTTQSRAAHRKQTRKPQKDDKIIVIQSPMRYKYYTGRLQSSEKMDKTFEVEISVQSGKVLTTLEGTQFIVITPWFPEVGEYVVAPKIQGGTIAKVTKIDRDMKGSTATILPKYDIPRSKPSLFGKDKYENKKKLRGHFFTIDKKVEIANATIRRGVLEDKWDIVEGNNLVNDMLQLAMDIDTNNKKKPAKNDKKKPAEKSTRSPGGISSVLDVVNHFQGEKERLTNQFNVERKKFMDKIKELEHHLEMGDRSRLTQLEENEKLEAKIQATEAKIQETEADIKSAKAKEMDIDTFRCPICYGLIIPLLKNHLESLDIIEEVIDEFDDDYINNNNNLSTAVTECGECHVRFHTSCINSWINSRQQPLICPKCNRPWVGTEPTKHLKMSWFVNRLHLKF